MKSLADLMEDAYDLSLKLCYGTLAPDGTCLHPRTLRDKVVEDIAYGWADGLVHKHYERITTGHCSMQTMIDFDVGKFEETVISEIAKMKSVLSQIGPPVRLTYHEMQIQGYRGRWAGIFPLLTYPGHQPYSALP